MIVYFPLLPEFFPQDDDCYPEIVSLIFSHHSSPPDHQFVSVLPTSAPPFTAADGTSVYGSCRTVGIFIRRIVQLFNVYFLYTLLCISLSDAQSAAIAGRVPERSTRSGAAHAIVTMKESGENDQHGYIRRHDRSSASWSIRIRDTGHPDSDASITALPTTGDTIQDILQPKLYHTDTILIRSTRIYSTEGRTLFPASVALHDDLLRSRDLTVSEMLSSAPGLSLVRDGAWQTSISIRGMNRSSIVTIVDNTRIETANDIAGALSLINVHDLEQVETIRSSGAAVYGTGSIGGIVHFMTKRAVFTDGSRLQAELNSELATVNNCTSQFLAVEHSSERLAGRFSAGVRHAGDVATPSGILPNSQFRDFSATASLGIKTFGEQKLHLSYQLSQAEDAGISGGTPIAPAATATYQRMRRELLGCEYTLPALSGTVSALTARLSYQQIIRAVEIVQSPALLVTPHAVHSTITAQIEAKIDAGTATHLVIGADVWQRNLTSKREKTDRTSRTIVGDIPIPHSQFFSAGFYAQNEWHVLPDVVSFVAGARYDRITVVNDETVDPEYIITNGSVNRTPPGQSVLWKSGHAMNDSRSMNAGVQYSPMDHLTLSWLASAAFRAPSLEERYQYLTLGDGIHVGNPDLKPERSRGMNAGARWHSDGLILRSDFYINLLSGLVTDVPGNFEGSPAFVKQNISTARLYGFEISGEHQLFSGSALTFTLSSVRGENTTDHTHLPSIPPVHGSIEFHTCSIGSGTLTLSSVISAAQTNTADGEKETPGYAIFGVSAESIPMTSGAFSLTVRGGIRNLFNKGYHHHLSTVRGMNREEPGRNFVLSLDITM